ncbi:hypothetical protein IWZ01DRAFT_6015 [Phyllosticta capitalensis]
MEQPCESANEKVSLSDLSPDHVAPLKGTLTRILATEVARRTFAQIVDGVQLEDKRFEPSATHPGRSDVCPRAYEVLDAFRDNFSFDMLQFDTKKAQAYQNTPVDSKDFGKHLLEMTAVSLHEIGASLFRLADGGLHKDDHEAPSDQNLSLFHHTHYKDWTQCRQGTANDAGYWVELKILGGVVIFDRGESGLEYGQVYLHPFRYKIFSLLPFQVQAFVDFGTGLWQESYPPLPMKPKVGADRLDNYDSFDRHIFRDRYERTRPPPNVDRYGRPPDRIMFVPEDELDFMDSIRRGVESGLLPPNLFSAEYWAPIYEKDGAPPQRPESP